MNFNNQRTRLPLLEIAGIAVRTPILFLLDFTLNGALIAFAVNNFQLLSNDRGDRESGIKELPNAYDVLFALERQNVTELWSELSYTHYFFWYLFYLQIILGCLVAFFMDTNVLLTLTGYVSPFVLAIASLTFSLEDSATNDANFKRTLSIDDRFTNYKSLTTLIYRLFIRGAYGYGVGRFYLAWRRPIYAQFPLFARDRIISAPANNYRLIERVSIFALLRLPFFVPFFNTIFANFQIPSTMIWAIFTPLLISETYYCFFLLQQFLLPYYFIARTTITEMVARPDIMRLQTFVILIWSRLRIPQVFRSFFLARFTLHLIYVLYVGLLTGRENDPYSVLAKRRLSTDWLWTGGVVENSDSTSTKLGDDDDRFSMFVSASEYLLARCCETVPAIMAATSVVAIFGRWAGFVFHWILTGDRNRNRGGDRDRQQQEHMGNADDEGDHVEADENQESVGSLTAALFFVLCLQTGLTTLTAEKRLWKLYRNLWLLSMAILHFVHHMVTSTMTRLCTHGRFHWTKHFRAVVLGLFLLLAPLLFFKCSWRRSNWLNPWLISVAIFAVELTAKMFVSFLTYVLMLWDVWYPRYFTDELLYGVKTTGAVLDFLFGVCLLVNGVWILLYEHGGLLRTFMICIHGYFNIYQRAKKGLAHLKRRRLATRKLDTLKYADDQKLAAAKDEVCPICYVEFFNSENDQDGSTTPRHQNDVKVTACGHLLHRDCLLKWLYIRDSCPLCHQPVFEDESLSANVTTENDDDEFDDVN